MNYPEALSVWGLHAAGPQWTPKELTLVLTLSKNGFHLHQNALKSVGGWGSTPDPNSERECRRRAPSALASLSRTVGNGVNAIQKWVPFTPKCSQKRWRLGLRPIPPNSEGERLRRLPVWHTELKMVLTLFKNGFYLHPNAPKSVGGWGSTPDPPSALASLTCRGEGAPVSIFAPGARNPRYATAS